MRVSLILCLSLVGVVPASAQLALPGATAPAPVGSVVQPEKRAASHAKVAPPAPSPPESNLAGKTLHLNGGKSEISFTPRDKTVDLARLSLSGTRLSKAGEACQVDVAGLPLPLSPAGRVGGLNRLTIPVPACPLVFDVLQGAILVPADAAACTFTEADCRAEIAGLWGPAPGEIGPDEVKTIERERMQSERGVRAAYQGLVHSTKDRVAIRGFASDQAGFSSKREETCRDYIGETRHGYCASRLTEARASALETTLAAADAQKDAKRKKPAR